MVRQVGEGSARWNLFELVAQSQDRTHTSRYGIRAGCQRGYAMQTLPGSRQLLPIGFQQFTETLAGIIEVLLRSTGNHWNVGNFQGIENQRAH